MTDAFRRQHLAKCADMDFSLDMANAAYLTCAATTRFLFRASVGLTVSAFAENKLAR